MRKLLFSKEPVYVIIKLLICLVLVVVFCANPSSMIGKKAMIRLAITIPINIVAHILLYGLICFGSFYCLRSVISDENKTVRLISSVFLFVLSIFLFFIFLTDNYSSVRNSGTITGDFCLWENVVSDLYNDDAIILKEVSVTEFHFPGYITMTSAEGNSYYIVVKENGNYEHVSYRFPLKSRDRSKLEKINDKSVVDIEYYASSGLIKSLKISSDSIRENDIEKVEISFKEREYEGKKYIDIYRPQMSDSQADHKIYWYVTKDGEYYDCFQAWRIDSTNFLSFEEKGRYTITLVTDWNEETSEYTPISNTIEYSKLEDGLAYYND